MPALQAILWKEWREDRAKYAIYWLILNLPVLVVSLALGFSQAARTPFRDLANATVLKYLPLALGETFYVTTVVLLATAYLAVTTFVPEIEDGSLFFVYERPVPRTWYAGVKLLNGALHAVLAICFSILVAPPALYAIMLLSGKVTSTGSGAAFAAVAAASARSAVWASLISMVVFTASALLSALLPKWWLAMAVSLAGTVLFGYFTRPFFDFASEIAGEPMSIFLGLSTGSSEWVTVTRPLTMAEVHGFAPWHAVPLVTAALLSALFAAATIFLYKRKELK